jgi:hypothetical protein
MSQACPTSLYFATISRGQARNVTNVTKSTEKLEECFEGTLSS